MLKLTKFSFNQREIKKVLTSLGFKFNLKSINHLNLNKIIINFFDKKDKRIKTLKLSSGNLANIYFKNEVNAYNNINEISKILNIYPAKIIKTKNKNLNIIEMKYLGFKKAKYFDFFKTFNFNKYKKLNFKKNEMYSYFKKIENRYSIKKAKNQIKINYIKKKFLDRYKINKVFTSFSHGDCIHWNTLLYNGKFYSIDYEFYDNQRSIFFDFIHWFFFPLMNKLDYLKLNFKIFPIYIIIFFLKTLIYAVGGKKVTFDNAKIYIFFYIFEKLLQFENELNYLSKKKINVSTKYKKKLENNIVTYLRILDIII
jgi:hypothetical protein